MLAHSHFLLTRKEYRDLTGESRQNVANKIKRGTLKTVPVQESVSIEKIILTAEEMEAISLSSSQA